MSTCKLYRLWLLMAMLTYTNDQQRPQSRYMLRLNGMRSCLHCAVRTLTQHSSSWLLSVAVQQLLSATGQSDVQLY
jgi:hypothetical protein